MSNVRTHGEFAWLLSNNVPKTVYLVFEVLCTSMDLSYEQDSHARLHRSCVDNVSSLEAAHAVVTSGVLGLEDTRTRQT